MLSKVVDAVAALLGILGALKRLAVVESQVARVGPVLVGEMAEAVPLGRALRVERELVVKVLLAGEGDPTQKLEDGHKTDEQRCLLTEYASDQHGHCCAMFDDRGGG